MTYDTSAYDAVYSAVVAKLTRQGVIIGKTAFLPRIEVHTITEGQRMDKAGDVRQMELTVESISNASLAAAVTMNEKNLELLTKGALNLGTSWTCLGVVPVQLQDLTESSDSDKIIYRLLQEFTIYLEKTKTDEAEEIEPDGPGPEPEPENPEIPDEVEDEQTENDNN